MTLEELIVELKRAQELATEGEPWEVRGTGILKMQSREFIECHSPSDAQAIAIRHNTGLEVLSALKLMERQAEALSRAMEQVRKWRGSAESERTRVEKAEAAVGRLKSAAREVVTNDGGCVDIDHTKASRFCPNESCGYCYLQRAAGFEDPTP